MEIEIKPIGYVKRASSEEDVKDKSLVSRIVLEKYLAKALNGIEDFSHIFVISWLHRILNIKKIDLTIHPRGRVELPLVGIFATRAPIRPNPIGLTLVELLKREANVLWVKGLDVFNETPVLDIKPCDKGDLILNARVPNWLTEIAK